MVTAQKETVTRAAVRRRRLVAILVLCGITGGALVGRAVYKRYYGEPKRFAVVDAGVLYRSAQPKPGQIDHLAREVGIKTIVIAREGTSKAVPDEEQRAKENGASVVAIPVESRLPIPDDQIEWFFRIVDDPARRPVLVHCSAGRHRTGLLCALYRIERQGWSVDRAMAEMLSFGFDTESQSVVQKQLEAYRPGRFAKRMSADAGNGPSAP